MTKTLISLNNVSKTYQTEAGEFLALKNIDLQVDPGEFVAVIGKSGSGKSTLINMLTGIDHATTGSVDIAGTNIVGLSEDQMAHWRGKNLGIVFQFFQLLPTLTVAENVMLPMDFANLYTPTQRLKKARQLLNMVEISKDQADKLPSQLSGGQQQRVAIARALANNPKIIAADEPTGNLDSKTASLIFNLFTKLVESGTTIIMVTHDRDLASKVDRTLVISDGEIIEQHLSNTFPTLNEKQLIKLTKNLTKKRYAPGQIILKKGEPVTKLAIVVKGAVEIVIEPNDNRKFVAAKLTPGKYFGEIELMQNIPNSLATVRASSSGPVEIVRITKESFQSMIASAKDLKQNLSIKAKKRLQEHKQLKKSSK